MNYKSIIFYLGVFSLLVSSFSFLNILYSIYFSFLLDLNSYLITFLISLTVGSLFLYTGRKHRKNISLNDQMLFILLRFLFIPLLISIPYYLSIYKISLLNSYFEAISGFTTNVKRFFLKMYLRRDIIGYKKFFIPLAESSIRKILLFELDNKIFFVKSRIPFEYPQTNKL